MSPALLALLAALPASAPALPQAARDWGLTAEELARASAGEVVVRSEVHKTSEGKDAGGGRAWVVINAPAEQAFAQLERYEDAPLFMPRVEKVTFLKRSPDQELVRQDVKVLFSTYSYVLDLRYDRPALTVRWTLDLTQKNDIKDTSGAWELRPLPGGRCLLRYTVALDTGAMVPAFLQDYLTRRDLPEVLLSLKRRVESGGTWVKG